MDDKVIEWLKQTYIDAFMAGVDHGRQESIRIVNQLGYEECARTLKELHTIKESK